MIELAVQGEKIELVDHDGTESPLDLVRAVETFRLEADLKTRHCYACGLCCYDDVPVLGYDLAALRAALGDRFDRHVCLPARPDLAARRGAVRDLARQHGLQDLEAVLIYEHNNSQPVTMARESPGPCLLLQDRLCTIYAARPFICRLYVCNMGEKLEALYDAIVSQGVWHSYHLLGWVPAAEIVHNPFLAASAFDELHLGSFEEDLEPALEKLFFYF